MFTQKSLLNVALAAILLCMSVIAQPLAREEQPASPETRSAAEMNLVAAFTLRIAKFIEWPSRPTMSKDRPYFIVGIMGEPEAETAFALLDGKAIKGKKVKTVRVTPSTDFHDLQRCHIIFADASSDQDVLAEMTRRSKGILTVYGPNSNPPKSPCINLLRQGDKLAFDINLQCTREAELNVDAGVIKLARKIKR